MKTWKLELLAAALSLAMATTAGAQSTNSKTMPGTATTPPGATMRSDIPSDCVSLTGQARSDCVRDHNPSSTRSKAGTTGNGMGNADSDAHRGTTGAMRNDKSGSGTGTTGSSSGASTGTPGTTGAAGTGTGASGAGTAGTGGTGGAAGGTGGDTGGGAGTGGGNGK